MYENDVASALGSTGSRLTSHTKCLLGLPSVSAVAQLVCGAMISGGAQVVVCRDQKKCCSQERREYLYEELSLEEIVVRLYVEVVT